MRSSHRCSLVMRSAMGPLLAHGQTSPLAVKMPGGCDGGAGPGGAWVMLRRGRGGRKVSQLAVPVTQQITEVGLREVRVVKYNTLSYIF